MRDSSRAAAFGVALALACAVDRPLDTAADTTGAVASTTAAASTEAPSGPTTGAVTSGAASTSTVTSDTSTVDDDGLCGPYDLSCPAGQKCTNVDSGSGFWDSSACVPAVPNGGGIGDPCGFAEGASVWSGLDDCAPGLFCFDFALETGLGGSCHEYCDERADCPLTNGGDAVCIESSPSLGLLGICFAACDPLLQDCADMEGCYGAPSIPGFFCSAPSLDMSPGDRGASCEFVNACLPGLSCQPSERVDGCAQDGSSCCTPFCSVAGGQGLCAANEQCVPFYANPPAPELADFGVCLLPA